MEEVGKDNMNSDRTCSGINDNSTIIKMSLRITILAAAAALIVAGIFTQGFADVRGKAIMICLECIGIG